MVISSSLVYSNARPPILYTEEGIVIEVSGFPKNASGPISNTEEGMVIAEILQFCRAPYLNLVVPSGMM